LIVVLLHHHGVASAQKHAVDQFERLERARRDEEIVGRALDAGVALELLHQEIAQRPVALWTARGEAVSGKRSPLAAQHRVGGRDKIVERKRVRVVVAAGEVVGWHAVEFLRRRRQAGAQQRGEVESVAQLNISLNLAFRLRAFFSM
jgi:hypothetical protein